MCMSHLAYQSSIRYDISPNVASSSTSLIPKISQHYFGQYLYKIILKKNLQHMYPPDVLETLTKHLVKVNLYDIYKQWDLPTFEMMLDTSALSLFNTVIVVQDDYEDTYAIMSKLTDIYKTLDLKQFYAIKHETLSNIENDRDIWDVLAHTKHNIIHQINIVLSMPFTHKPLLFIIPVHEIDTTVMSYLLTLSPKFKDKHVYFKIIQTKEGMLPDMVNKYMLVSKCFKETFSSFQQRGIVINQHTWLVYAFLKGINDDYEVAVKDELNIKLENFVL